MNSSNVVNARLFQYYLDSFFKIPSQIKNDIAYCQRALKTHIKVHQMVIEVFEQQGDADPLQKKRILEELESEIYEINAEQQFLFLRLKRIIDEFNKILKGNNVPRDNKAVNNHVSRQLITLVSDEGIEITPIQVFGRKSEEKLIKKYFEVENDDGNKNCYEILDSDDEGIVVVAEKPADKYSQKKICQENGKSSSINDNNNAYQQKSLLKPMSQRMMVGPNAGYTDATQFLQIVEEEFKPIKPTSDATEFLPNLDIKKEDAATASSLPVSKNVTMSRLNLRQALNKARSENMAAKQAAATEQAKNVVTTSQVNSKIATTITSLPHKNASSKSPPSVVVTGKKSDNKTSKTNKASKDAKAVVSEPNTSSDDSNLEQDQVNGENSNWPREEEETRTQPDDYGQEMFLRIFDLFTPEIHVLLAQRRSKRTRRTVRNERTEFHYGNRMQLNIPLPEDNKRKRKAFLLSPQLKRNLQSKRPKRNSADKSEDRSSSSSPDEKRGCNECMKGGGCLETCMECKGFYHQECHREEDDDKPMTAKRALGLGKLKLCPACKRQHQKFVKEESEQLKTLTNAAQELEAKMAKEKDRRAELNQTGKDYKIQMQKLFNIVNTIKSENDSE